MKYLEIPYLVNDIGFMYAARPFADLTKLATAINMTSASSSRDTAHNR